MYSNIELLSKKVTNYVFVITTFLLLMHYFFKPGGLACLFKKKKVIFLANVKALLHQN